MQSKSQRSKNHSARSLAQLLSTKVPITKAMGLRVLKCEIENGVRFALPLKPNRNHKNTAFGGSLIAAQALACWALICELLDKNNLLAEVVVQRQTGEFLRPVSGSFEVQTDAVRPKAVKRFLETMRRHNKARLQLTARVLLRGHVAGRYTGEYVALSISKKATKHKVKRQAKRFSKQQRT